MKEILFMGDSLTGFYDWQNRFPGFIVQNLGNAGEPVEGLIERLGKLRFLKSPDYLFLMTGINNLRRGDHDIVERLREVADFLAAEIKNGVVVLQSILPVTHWVPPAVIEEVNLALRRMAQAHGMTYLDLYILFLDKEGRPDPGLYEEDGVHLSGKGYTIWSGAVEDYLHGQN
jgi:lysophospholipase L1-like esterase